MNRPTGQGAGRSTRDEHGAVAVMVALLMVPLIGFVALAVDVSSLWSQRQQLQNGADAAALAIASDCLRNACGTPSQTASSFAAANLRSGTSTATVTARTSTSVTVRNDAVQSFVFAPVLGVRSAAITTEGNATWGSPIGGTAVLPVLLNYCEYAYQTGGGLPTSATSRTLVMSQTSVSSCRASGFGSYAPGGFAWARDNHTGCTTPSGFGVEVAVANTTSPPSNDCTEQYVTSLQNRTVLLPIFNSGRGDKNNAYVKVSGYAAFKLTGYNLGSSYSWNAPCPASEQCLRGYFERVITADASFTYGSGPQLGAGIVSLTN